MENGVVPSQISTRLTQLWGIDLPIVGAPMAGRAGGELAAAVSQAGGLGMFGVGDATSPDWILDNAEIAAKPNKPFGIGLMVWALENNPAQFDAALEAKPKVLSLGFGDPSPYVGRAHDQGISVVAPINTVAQLRAAINSGVDSICIQGTDAGGHTGRIGTMPLMQMALGYAEAQAPAIPTAVAGGIGSGRGLAAALAAGADAAWIGTSLLACPEALGSEELKTAAVDAGSGDTLLTDIYDRAEQKDWDTQDWPTRTVRNGFTDAFAAASEYGEVRDEELVAVRAEGGDFADDLKLHAGQGLSMVTSQRPANEVVKNIAAEALRLLTRKVSWN